MVRHRFTTRSIEKIGYYKFNVFAYFPLFFSHSFSPFLRSLFLLNSFTIHIMR